MDQLASSLGVRYYRETMFGRDSLGRAQRLAIEPAPPFKEYPEAEKFDLPRSWHFRTTDLGRLLQQRRSRRSYSREPLALAELAGLCWASQGVTAAAGPYLLRTAPSAGALYPLETYVAIRQVEDLSPGIYHFNPRDFQLALLSSPAPSEALARAALGQRFVAQAGAVFIWTAVFRRNMAKYGHRGLRYICMDAGHLCQNLLLAAEAFGRAACPVAAFFDGELNELLGVDGGEESALYLATVGSTGGP